MEGDGVLPSEGSQTALESGSPSYAQSPSEGPAVEGMAHRVEIISFPESEGCQLCQDTLSANNAFDANKLREILASIAALPITEQNERVRTHLLGTPRVAPRHRHSDAGTPTHAGGHHHHHAPKNSYGNMARPKTRRGARRAKDTSRSVNATVWSDNGYFGDSNQSPLYPNCVQQGFTGRPVSRRGRKGVEVARPDSPLPEPPLGDGAVENSLEGEAAVLRCVSLEDTWPCDVHGGNTIVQIPFVGNVHTNHSHPHKTGGRRQTRRRSFTDDVLSLLPSVVTQDRRLVVNFLKSLIRTREEEEEEAEEEDEEEDDEEEEGTLLEPAPLPGQGSREEEGLHLVDA